VKTGPSQMRSLSRRALSRLMGAISSR
jgi:hypothetical protein